MNPNKSITPIILWDGDDELITTSEWVERGDLDAGLVQLLENTAVYRDLLLRDPECSQLADPNQQRLVDRGYRSLTNRLSQVEGAVTAAIRVAKINLTIEQCKD